MLDAAGPASAEGIAAHDVDLQMFAVCNSRLIGGGRLIAPEAVIDDGWLDVCVVEAMPTLEFVGLLRQVARGEHLATRASATSGHGTCACSSIVSSR